MKKVIILVGSILIASCAGDDNSHTVICPKVKKMQGNELYCSIPYVEMQANYQDLDGMLISVHGVLVLMAGEALLVDPSTNDYDIPRHYNVVAVEVDERQFEKLLPLNKKYVSVLGKFNAKYIGGNVWSDSIAHSISSAEIHESFP